jgi:anti-anti-sigma factor
MRMSQTVTRPRYRLAGATATAGLAQRVNRNEKSMAAVPKLSPKADHIVHVTGPLLTPVSRTLRHRVRALLRDGERRIVLDLSAISRIDAAGVGELIRAFNMTVAVNGALRVVNVTGWVREILERARLFELLSRATIDRRLA